jgi:ribosomal-protein-alanine N-acetyltransferase
MRDIRWMNVNDLDACVAIELDSFKTAWTKRDFQRNLAEMSVVGMVCEIDGEIAGYVIYKLTRRNIEVINLAVSVKYRRTGVASAILKRLKHKLCPNGKHTITAIVTDSNLPAHLLFRSSCLIATNCIRDWYGDGIDAIRFQYTLNVMESQTCNA